MTTPLMKLFIDEQMNPIHMEEHEAKDDNMLSRILDILFLSEYYKHAIPSYESRFTSNSVKKNLPS